MEKKCFLCTIKHYAKPYKDRRRLSRNTARDATYLLVIIEKQKLIDEISARRFVTEAPLSLSQVCMWFPPSPRMQRQGSCCRIVVAPAATFVYGATEKHSAPT